MALFVYEAGPARGKPLLFFHGFPGSHTQGKLLEPWLQELNLRLYAPDRPGYGRSPPQNSGGLPEFTSELRRWFSAKGIAPRHILGISGGTPSAVRAAIAFGGAVKSLGIVSGLGPWRAGGGGFTWGQSLGLTLARRVPKPLIGKLIGHFLRGKDPAKEFDHFARRLHPADQRVLQDPLIRPLLLASLEESLTQGPAGILFDAESFVSPWLAKPELLKTKIKIWHGEDDRLLSPAMARSMAGRLPKAELALVPGEGHYSLPVYRGRELLKQLVT